nr:isoprenylcysteine carboxylmethyltransferase family protein [uncultured Sphingomonas sp.]
MISMWPTIAILGFVTLQRVIELPIARANTARLLAKGGREVGGSHYPFIVALHAAWLATLWVFAPGQVIHWGWFALFLMIEIGRVWTLRSLGPRWTTRIIIVPGETLVARGPYKYVNHPNYVVVVAEIAVLPLVFGLWQAALIFSALNGIMLWVRIGTENKALGR